MALQGDTDGAILGARVKQFLTSILFTAFVRIMPVDDKVPPMDQRFVRAAIAALLESNLVRDDGISVVHGAVKSGGVRSIALAEFPAGDRAAHYCDFNMDIASAVNSQFILRMLAGLNATQSSPLCPEEQSAWFQFTPEGDATHTFSLLLLPSVRSDHTALTAFSSSPTTQVRANICQFLQVPNLDQLPLAVYARGSGTEVLSLEPGLLARLIWNLTDLGTPANSEASSALCRPIRELPSVTLTRARPAGNAISIGSGGTPDRRGEADPNPPFQPGDQFNPMPRAVLRMHADMTLPGPSHSLTFRCSRGAPGEIITVIALRLAGFFQSWNQSPSEATSYDYWMPRILVKLRSNRPIRVVIAVSYGALFVGVYEALQGEVIDNLDRLTQVALSTGQNLSPVCLGGIFCNKCGQPGHIARDCPQSPITPRNELTYRCPMCGELAGPVKGHEWDACHKYKTIRMGAPTDTTCGICGHPEHATPQCPSLFDTRLGEALLSPKMSSLLLEAGWTLGTAAQPSPQLGNPATTPTRLMSQIPNVISPASSSSSALSQVDTTSALSVSASALAAAEATNAIVMADLQDNLIRKLQLELSGALQRELQPLRTELGEVRQAVAEQGRNVNTLAEVVGQNTTFMLKVSAANKRTGQQILALRDQLNRELNIASRPADQASVVSQDDLFLDSVDYDPNFPSDTWIGEPSPPGLESPASGMLI